MLFKLYPLNFIVIGLIILPNILYAFFPPSNIPAESKKPRGWHIIIILEWIGRLGTFILPLFWELNINGRIKTIILLLMFFCLLGYYGGWLKYIIKGKAFRLLFEPLFFIPVPMAVFPVLYLILTGILLNSWLVALAAIIFAFGHIPESLRNYYALENV